MIEANETIDFICKDFNTSINKFFKFIKDVCKTPEEKFYAINKITGICLNFTNSYCGYCPESMNDDDTFWAEVWNRCETVSFERYLDQKLPNEEPFNEEDVRLIEEFFDYIIENKKVATMNDW